MPQPSWRTNTSSPHARVAPKEMFSMKVMRLPSPQLATHTGLAWKAHTLADVAEPYSLASSLTISSVAGKVYLGEVFRACVSISHQARFALDQAGIKIEVQTQSHKVTLVDTTSPAHTFTFAASESKDHIVEHPISEIGTNCLICGITYLDEERQRRSFQKFFKFEVENPINVATAFHQRDGLVFVEACLTNLMPRTIILENVSFAANDCFNVVDLNCIQDETNDNEGKNEATPEGIDQKEQKDTNIGGFVIPALNPRSVFGPVVTVEPNATRSYLFQILDKEPASALALSIGQFRIAWRSNIGEKGQLLSALITRQPLAQNSVLYDLKILEVPSKVCLEQPFELVVEVRNKSDRRLELTLSMATDRMTILPYGSSLKKLGMFEGKTSKKFRLSMLPIGLGVQRIAGFCLLCPTNDTQLYLDTLHQVEVSIPASK